MDEFRIQAIGFASRDPVATKKAIETLRSQPQEHTHEMIRRMDSTAPHMAAMGKYLQASLDTQMSTTNAWLLGFYEKGKSKTTPDRRFQAG